MNVSAFAIHIPEDELTDLRRRLASTRWPRAWPEPPWAAGSDGATLRRLRDAWVSFDWRACEARLNALPQYIATIDGQRVHFLRFRGDESLPVVLTNGWPSTFAEMVPVARLLASAGHDGRSGRVGRSVAAAAWQPEPGFGAGRGGGLRAAPGASEVGCAADRA
jgi:Epoxide hydrolase N terminus